MLQAGRLQQERNLVIIGHDYPAQLQACIPIQHTVSPVADIGDHTQYVIFVFPVKIKCVIKIIGQQQLGSSPLLKHPLVFVQGFLLKVQGLQKEYPVNIREVG